MHIGFFKELDSSAGQRNMKKIMFSICYWFICDEPVYCISVVLYIPFKVVSLWFYHPFPELHHLYRGGDVEYEMINKNKSEKDARKGQRRRFW